MRVPIYPQDLAAGRGFKRIAKCLKRDWLGTEPIRLSEAHHILARCLGYNSYHDAARSSFLADECYSASAPPLVEVLSNCYCVIWSELISGGHCRVFSANELLELIYSWPFLQLTTYREQYGHSDMQIIVETIKAQSISGGIGESFPVSSPEGFNAKNSKELQAMIGNFSRQLPSDSTHPALTKGTCPSPTSEHSAEQLLECLACPPFIAPIS